MIKFDSPHTRSGFAMDTQRLPKCNLTEPNLLLIVAFSQRMKMSMWIIILKVLKFKKEKERHKCQIKGRSSHPVRKKALSSSVRLKKKKEMQ